MPATGLGSDGGARWCRLGLLCGSARGPVQTRLGLCAKALLIWFKLIFQLTSIVYALKTMMVLLF